LFIAVILNEVKDFKGLKNEILRYAQNDKMGALANFARCSEIIPLGEAL
jgi:hypothetical protein